MASWPSWSASCFAVGVALAFIVLRLPKFLVIGFTAFGGAFATIAGLALLLGRVRCDGARRQHRRRLPQRPALAGLWVGAAILLGIGGFFYQWMRSALTAEMVDYNEYRNPGMPDKAPMRPM